MKRIYHRDARWLMGLTLIGVLLGWAGIGHCAGFFRFEDIEKPKPEFTTTKEGVTVKLVPRAKNTSIQINFQVIDGGRLAAVKGVDFMEIDRPEVDVKNFKSAAFEMQINDVKPGGEAKVALTSDFFTSATAFYVYNPLRDKPWMDAHAQNLAQPDKARRLVVTVRDGGELDADGAANGRITLIGGPRDSFWGYALGTLLIRFFGIFIVLSFLMVGMLVSGFIFKKFGPRQIKGSGEPAAPRKIASQPDAAPAETVTHDTGPPAGPLSQATEQEVAAIAAALHLHFAGNRPSPSKPSSGTSACEDGWAVQGRTRMMNERLMVFNRRCNK